MSNGPSDYQQPTQPLQPGTAEESTSPTCLHSELMNYALACCPRLYDYTWWESADALASSITTTTGLCADMASSIAEIKALWLAHLLVFAVVRERHAQWRLQQAQTGIEEGGRHNEELRTLLAATEAFTKAFYRRGNASVQAKYAEARLAGRRSLKYNHHPMFDGFPKLVETLRRVCSGEVATYITDEVGLPNDQFLEAIEFLAREQINPLDVANPPARILVALSRDRRRKFRLEEERWISASEKQTSGLKDPENVESTAIATVDWERGSQAVGLPEDQRLAIDARIEGLNLQGSDAPEYLEWDAARLEAVRRSLAPDRHWGRKLRKWFSVYALQKSGRTAKSLKGREQ